MTVSVSKTASQWLPADRPHTSRGVLIGGKRWSIWSIHATQKKAVSQGNRVKVAMIQVTPTLRIQGSRHFRVRVTKITPELQGRSWAVVVMRK